MRAKQGRKQGLAASQSRATEQNKTEWERKQNRAGHKTDYGTKQSRAQNRAGERTEQSGRHESRADTEERQNKEKS